MTNDEFPWIDLSYLVIIRKILIVKICNFLLQIILFYIDIAILKTFSLILK